MATCKPHGKNVCYHRAIVLTLLEFLYEWMPLQLLSSIATSVCKIAVCKMGCTKWAIELEFAMRKWSKKNIIAVALWFMWRTLKYREDECHGSNSQYASIARPFSFANNRPLFQGLQKSFTMILCNLASLYSYMQIVTLIDPESEALFFLRFSHPITDLTFHQKKH